MRRTRKKRMKITCIVILPMRKRHLRNLFSQRNLAFPFIPILGSGWVLYLWKISQQAFHANASKCHWSYPQVSDLIVSKRSVVSHMLISSQLQTTKLNTEDYFSRWSLCMQLSIREKTSSHSAGLSLTISHQMTFRYQSRTLLRLARICLPKNSFRTSYSNTLSVH